MADQTSEDFEAQLRDCLIHLYDYAFLQSQPLVHQLIPESTGEATRVQLFRQTVLEAIEQLKPAADSNPQSAHARTWRILTLRYVKQQPTAPILHQLNLSERQFYRDHIKAIQTLAQVLTAQVAVAPLSAAETAISIQSEIDRIHDRGDSALIAAAEFLNKAVSALHGLITRYGSDVTVEYAPGMLDQHIDQTLLRQTIIWILSQIIIQIGNPTRIVLSSDSDQAGCRFSFTVIGSSIPALTHALYADQDTLHSLIGALSGRLFEDVTVDGATIVLEVPLKPHTLLIVDDNPDAINLFRRYLSGQPYQLSVAYDGLQALQRARLLQPEVIVLDVMLPQQDGWEILQSLKSHPETCRIPVLICSVLNTSALALSLGADGFLRKPPGETDFLNALAPFIDPQPEPR